MVLLPFLSEGREGKGAAGWRVTEDWGVPSSMGDSFTLLQESLPSFHVLCFGAWSLSANPAPIHGSLAMPCRAVCQAWGREALRTRTEEPAVILP